MSSEVLSAGILVADHLCTPIPRVPRAGELILADALPLSIGGCAANVAMDLTRLGVGVSISGCVGEDAFGDFVRDTLEARGVDTRSLRRLSGVGTSGTLIINVAGEDRRFIHSLGANARFTAEHVPDELFEQVRVFYLGGYLLTPALEPRALAALFRQARRSGAKTVLDVVLPGPGDHWALLEPVLAETDVFLPNGDEAQAITGLVDPVRQAERFLEAGAGAAVITRGEEGCLLMSRGGVHLRSRAHQVEYVGGTGAGDAFDAGYIAGLLADADPQTCLAWGSAVGASCVRSISATESVFSRAEAEAFLRQHPLQVQAF
ncbi:MAG: carbohydrate kinase family protein [Pirellulales bacterium]